MQVRLDGGLRRVDRGVDAVLVSDVGKSFKVRQDARAGGLLRTAVRASDILMDRVGQLEKEIFGETPGFLYVPITRVVTPEEDPTADDARAGFDVTFREETPPQPAGVGVEAVQPARLILVEALADVQPAAGDARRREDVFHLAAVIENPQHLPAGPIQAVHRPARFEAKVN